MERTTQQQRILNLLKSRSNQWVGLDEILDLRIGQYNTRIKELRGAGHTIENKTEWWDGIRHSWFRLVVSSYPFQMKFVGMR